MRRLLVGFVALALIGLCLGLWLTRTKTADPAQFTNLQGDVEAGSAIFSMAGCASCHTAPGSDEKLVLAGGQEFVSDFGTFYAPNISPSDSSIKGWTVTDLANALWHGTSPSRQHYFPALPYTAYQHMTAQDVANLHAYMQTLPESDQVNRPHDVGFPFNIRRGVGGWKLLFFSDDFVLQTLENPQIERGRYLVEALGHCGECHTPRGFLGQLDKSRWLQGAPNPSGAGQIPGIDPGQLDWIEDDIAYYLETGFTPEFDSAGGKMADVIENTAKLSPEDRSAIAAYLKAVQPSN